MKLLLIQPSHFKPDGSVFKSNKLIYPGLALPLIAGMSPRDWEIELLNDYSEEVTGGESADLVAISSMTPQAVRGFDIARKFRARGVPVVMGGFHGSLYPDEAAKECDALVMGEAEYLWPELVRDFQSNGLKKIYKSDRIVDLADVPIPRYDLIKSSGYALSKVRPAQTTRGCPHKCEFCSVHRFFGGKYRHRPVNLVLEDLKAANTRHIFFVDDNIAAHRKYALELFKALEPLHLYWGSQCNITVAKDIELLRAASRAGCFSLFLGVESINPESLKRFGKSFNKVEDYVQAFKTIKAAGIEPMVSMIMGLDGDGPETFAASLRFLVKNKIPIAYVFILTPAPGTPLFDRFIAEGRLFSTDWNRYGGDEAVFYPENYSPETLEKEFWKLLKSFYSLKSIFVRFFLPFHFSKRRIVALKYNLLHRASLARNIHPLRG